MEFLSPWYIPALAAGLTVPPLVIMYFLRLRRRETPVPTTYLWRKAVEDLQVNMPFQKLRRNLLLLLQLMVLAAAILALGRPVRHVSVVEEERVVLMVDRSGSMSAVEGGRTRLEMAKEQAQAVVRGLGRGQKAMVVSFADTAEVICPFTADRGLLRERIDSIEASDRLTRLDEAVRLAKAYGAAGAAGEAGRAESPAGASRAKALVFSDGAVGDAQAVEAGPLNLEYVKIGQSGKNVGITAMEARREYMDPRQVQVFVRMENFSAEEEGRVGVAIYVNGELAAAKDVALAARAAGPREGQAEEAVEAGEGAMAKLGGSRTLAFDLTCEDAAVIEARLQIADGLAADNAARVCLPPATESSVLLVSGGNIFLEKVLAGLPLRTFEVVKPEEYAKVAGRAYDVTLFDRWAPEALGEGCYIFFGCVPPTEGYSRGAETDEAYVVDFDSMHPIMRHVSVDEIRVGQWNPTSVPKGAKVLVETSVGPAITYASAARQQVLVVSFDLSKSVWPVQVGFPVFMYNAVRHLRGSAMQAERSLRPGQTMEIDVSGGLKDVEVRTPEGQVRRVSSGGQGYARFAGTDRAGLYRVGPEGAGPRPEMFAVNLTDGNESDIAPRETLRVGSQLMASGAGMQGANQPVWPWAIGAALGLLCVEWYIYNRRVMV